MPISTQATRNSTSPSTQLQRPFRRLWRAPRSNAWWLSMLAALLVTGVIVLYFVKTRGFDYTPSTGPLPRFGIIALGLLAVSLAYTLRRRFFRGLPGKAQDWLWVHSWAGIAILVTILLHANFYYVVQGYCYSPRCLSLLYGTPSR